jgi:tetrahydromethanopterin S-methyltransferase subunit A
LTFVAWPRVKGDYLRVREDSRVVVITLGTDKERFTDIEALLVGSCKTENLGLERIIVNVIANPAIRFMVVTGSEVVGHRSGNALVCLHREGIDDEGVIKDAVGAVPRIENIAAEAVERFRQQVELVDMVGIDDLDLVARTVRELDDQLTKDYPGGPMEVEARRRIVAPLPTGSAHGDVWLSVDPAIEVDPFTGCVYLSHPIHVGEGVRIDAERGLVSC